MLKFECGPLDRHRRPDLASMIVGDRTYSPAGTMRPTTRVPTDSNLKNPPTFGRHRATQVLSSVSDNSATTLHVITGGFTTVYVPAID